MLKATIIIFILLSSTALAQEIYPEPPNAPVELEDDRDNDRLLLRYMGETICELDVFLKTPEGLKRPAELGISWLTGPAATGSGLLPESSVIRSGDEGRIEQQCVVKMVAGSQGYEIVLRGTVHASEEAFPAETLTAAQQRLPLVRNSDGLSRNTRNNAVYDRRFDWVLFGPGDDTRIMPTEEGSGDCNFSIEVKGKMPRLTFRPRFYQKHRNLPYYKPWTYQPWTGSIAGWCSWWPYRTEISEEVVDQVSKVFAERLRDYGYEYIQIDDGYQAGYGGLPSDWLNTNERFPGGLKKMNEIIRSHGLKPGLWVNVHFGNREYAFTHRNLFILNEKGEPHKGPWLDYGLDGSSKEAIDTVFRPVYRGLREMDWDYVKIDTLRHLMYDAIYPCRSHFEKKGISGEEAFRNLLDAARQELTRETFILACWGVLPEVIGIADGCRLGTDGFGPSTLVQYNSFNNVVWRNDPDHVDITPEGEEIIRPVTVCMAGAMMLLTDKVEVYLDDRKIEGARRCAPVPFTVPGQLYDFDPKTTDNLEKGLRNDEGGGPPGPIDAMQWGSFSPLWLLEIDRPFEHWYVLARMSWEDLPGTTVKFVDLGLDPDAEYLVYEYWTRSPIVASKESFLTPAQKKKEVRVYCIRKKLDRPQILSTSRHITQGGVDLVDVEWNDGVLSGRSRVVGKDPYTLVLHVPAGKVVEAEMGGKPAIIGEKGRIWRLTSIPAETGEIDWSIEMR